MRPNSVLKSSTLFLLAAALAATTSLVPRGSVNAQSWYSYMYCTSDSSQTPCVYVDSCPDPPGNATYCNGGAADPVPGMCIGPAQTTCVQFLPTSCGDQCWCSTRNYTTNPPTQCGTTVNPCQTMQN